MDPLETPTVMAMIVSKGYYPLAHLCGHYFRVGARDCNARVQTATIVRFDDIAAVDTATQRHL